MRNHDQRVAQVEGEGQKEGTKRDSWIRNVNSPRSLRKCGLHPLIHTLLKFNLAQDFGGGQAGGSVGEADTQGMRGVGLKRHRDHRM